MRNAGKKRLRAVGIGVAIGAAAIIAAFMLVSRTSKLPVHKVAIPIAAKGLDSAEGTAIPVHVTGKDARGESIDISAYVKRDGSGVELAEGTYAISVTASPIAGDGTMYSITGAASSATVDEDGKLTLGGDITLEPIPALEVTNEQIDAAFKAAKAGGAADEEAAGKLKDAATKRRDDAVAAKKEAEKKAAEKKKAEEEAKKKAAEEAAAAEEKKAATHFECEYFSVDVPESWADLWSVEQTAGNEWTFNCMAVINGRTIPGGGAVVHVGPVSGEPQMDFGTTSGGLRVTSYEAGAGFFTTGATLTVK